jgi:hypothetical protein
MGSHKSGLTTAYLNQNSFGDNTIAYHTVLDMLVTQLFLITTTK